MGITVLQEWHPALSQIEEIRLNIAGLGQMFFFKELVALRVDLLDDFGVFGWALSRRDLPKQLPARSTCRLFLLSGEQAPGKHTSKEHLLHTAF